MSLQEALTEALDLNVTQQGILNNMFPEPIAPVSTETCDCNECEDVDAKAFELGGLVFLKSDLDIALLFTIIGIDDEDQELLVAMVSNGEYKETVLPYEAVEIL